MKKKSDDETRAPLLGSSRFALCLMNFFALLFLYLLRTNISLTMVCMVRKSATAVPRSGSLLNYSTIDTTRVNASSMYDETGDVYTRDATTPFIRSNSTGKRSPYRGEFDWSRAFEGHVLSSYFYGYLSTMFLGGWLAGRYGGKHVVGAGLLISSVCTILIPPAVRLNKYLIIFLRVIIGVAAGLFVPSTLSLAGLWYSPHERSFLLAISRLGATMGSIVAFLVSSLFCEIKFDNGWPIAFYVTGGAGVLFWMLWNVMVYSSPDHHPRISQREKNYIAASTGIKTRISQRSKFPWFKAITSPAVWAIVFAQTSNTWFAYTALTSFPLYMRDVLRFNIKENGLFLILPHLLVMATNVPVGRLADVLIRNQLLSTAAVRRIIQTFASLTSSVLLVSLAFIDYDNRYIAVGLLTAINPIQSFSRSGYGCSPLDFAPRYSGEIFGISNTFGTLSGILAPVTVGYLTTNGLKQEWQMVFFIAAGMYAVGAIVFAVCVRGTVQPWADSVVMTTTASISPSAITGSPCVSSATVVLVTPEPTLNGGVPVTDNKQSDSLETLKVAGAGQNGNLGNFVSAPVSISSDKTNPVNNMECVHNLRNTLGKCFFGRNRRISNLQELK